jgi:FMN reductase (NADPH)/FMN reductase [NAD(P)H]
MNPVIQTILSRKSVRAYENKPIEAAIKSVIIQVALRAPTAGNMMLYSIIEVDDQNKKKSLAKTCDNQPFIAKAPLVLLFLADYQRWYDYFVYSGVEEACKAKHVQMRKPEEGDLMIACCDALIAAQTAVIAAESLGIGSCYIGDIMERWEINRDLFNLPPYTFPICLLCFGYPTKGQLKRKQTSRFDERFIMFKNTYKKLTSQECDEMFSSQQKSFLRSDGIAQENNVGQHYYSKKFNSDFSLEMNRSVRACLGSWLDRR